MIGIVIVTHGRLAEEFISVMEHIVGPQKQIEAVCMGPEDDMEKKRQEIITKTASVDSGRCGPCCSVADTGSTATVVSGSSVAKSVVHSSPHRRGRAVHRSGAEVR